MDTRSINRKPKPPTKPNGKLLIWLVIVSVLFAGWLSFKPMVEAIKINRENAGIKQQIARLRMQNQQLMKTVALLNTPMGKEIQARKLGYLNKGEAPFIVPK